MEGNGKNVFLQTFIDSIALYFCEGCYTVYTVHIFNQYSAKARVISLNT